ncbi:DUF4097 family beta strand repeat-containing protein [Heyndrickxia sporothermodurans]
MKKMMVGAFILLLIGIVGVASTLYLSKGSLFKLTEWEEKKSISSKEIKQLEINSAPVDVRIVKSTDDDIHVVLEGKESTRKKGEYKLKVDNNNGMLQINVKQKISWGIRFYSSAKLNVELPEKVYDSIHVKTSSGDLMINDFQAIKASFQASSGDVLVEDGNVREELSIEASSGEIEANNNEANNILLKTSSGDIINKNANAGKKLSIQATSGEIEAVNNQAENISMKTTSGDIDIQKLSALSSDFTSTSGEINIDDISGKVVTNASSGDISIAPNEQINDMDIETTSGEVHVKAKQSIPFAIDYKGSSGEGIISASGVTYTEKSDHLIVGKIGSGKVKLKVRTTSGDFILR